MNKNNKNAFTLVELLAVIAVLGLILIIAVPKITSVMENSKKKTLELTAKSIARSAEEKKIENDTFDIEEEITCDSISDYSSDDFSSCTIKFNEEGIATITIVGKGSYKGLYVCSGTKTEATATSESCPVPYGDGDTYITKLLAKEDELHNGLIQTYATVNGEQVDAGIRYAGAISDVKNQVYFNCAETDGTNAYASKDYKYADNCEIWRIIGVFDVDNGNGIIEKRIKIIRDKMLDFDMSWDTAIDGVNYINQWGPTTLTSDNTTPYAGASLMQYLNGDYHNSLTTVAKGQIDDVLWYTGAVVDDTASGVYENERSTATGSGTTVNYTTTWVGKIGLIYPSDFGYAGTNCGDKTILYYDESCGPATNWLTPSSAYYWTISPRASDSADAWLVGSGGYAVYTFGDANGVRPALYLDSNIQIIGGNGDTTPYKLKILIPDNN